MRKIIFNLFLIKTTYYLLPARLASQLEADGPTTNLSRAQYTQL